MMMMMMMMMIQRPNPLSSSRRPLQPKNLPHLPPTTTPANLKPYSPSNIQWTDDNKENIYSISAAAVKKDIDACFPIDASLADELSAIRERLHRVKIDRDRTEKLLGERVRMLDLQMKEILNRGEVQKQLEMELDRLYRLKEIKLACQRISPVRSLRDKEQEKRKN